MLPKLLCTYKCSLKKVLLRVNDPGVVGELFVVPACVACVNICKVRMLLICYQINRVYRQSRPIGQTAPAAEEPLKNRLRAA